VQVIHTEPQAFGKVMSAVKPRLAVGYHSVQSPENNAAIMDGVRKTYDGPLALARDLMVINVTKETIKVRMATVDEYVLPLLLILGRNVLRHPLFSMHRTPKESCRDGCSRWE
jgi:hypothetical protein